MHKNPMKLYPIFILLAMNMILASCQSPPSTSEKKVATIDSIKTPDASIEKQEESTLSKIIKLEKQHAEAPLLDSFLLLGIKSGTSRKDFDRIIATKDVLEIFFDKDNLRPDRYHFKLSEETPNIYCNARELLHDTCGLVGFEVDLLIENDTSIHRLAEGFLTWANEGIEDNLDRDLLTEYIMNYQASIVRNYTNQYGEPTIQDSEHIAWFIGRKMVHLYLNDFKFIMGDYEESGGFGLAYVSCQDLGLVK
jgi:hypothetical protein